MKARKGFLSILKLIFLSISFTAFGESVDVKKDKNNQEMILLTVDKASMTAELRTWPKKTSESRVLKTFTIAIGKAEGDKSFEGDNKTPEGIYFSQKHIDESTLLKSKYGPHAIPLNFPNLVDKYEGKTGHGIWLHGAGNDERISKTNVTEGCVAFYNEDIRKLRSWLNPYQAVIVIAKDKRLVNKSEDLAEISKQTKLWYQSWESRKVDDYLSYYDENFKAKGRKLKSFKKYKKRVFASYKKMMVSLDNIRVITHPKYAVSIMNQDFNGDDRYKSEGRKILFWKKNKSGQWKILREKYENRRFTPLEYTNIDLNKLEEGSASPSNPTEQSALPSISSSKS